MRTLIKGCLVFFTFAIFACADGVQPIVTPSQVLFGSPRHTITSTGTVTISTITGALSVQNITINGTCTGSGCVTSGGTTWGTITGNLANQTDLQTKLNAVGLSTAALQATATSLGNSTATLSSSITSVGVSTGTLAVSVAALGTSTTAIQSQVTGNTTSITTLSASTVAIQNQVTTNTASIATLSVSTTAIENQIVFGPSLAGSNTWSGQNNWTTPKPSTFTYGVVVGSMTDNDLTVSSFVVANANKKLSSFDLFNSNNNWSGSQTFNYPGLTYFNYGIVVGSQTYSYISNGLLGVNGLGQVIPISAISLSTQTYGNLPIANLNNGTGASASTFFRGDNTWAIPAGGSSGVSSMAVFNGSTLVSSPTLALASDSNTITTYAIGSSSAGFKVNLSSVTAKGNTFNNASQLVQLTAGGQYPAINGNLITNLNAASLSGTISSSAVNNAVLSQSTLQSGTTVYVSSGTVNNLNVQNTLNVNATGLQYFRHNNQNASGNFATDGLVIWGNNYAGNYSNTIGFGQGPIPSTSSLTYFGTDGDSVLAFYQNPTFGTFDYNGNWIGGFDTANNFAIGVSTGFEIGTSVGVNNFDVAGRAMIGADFTTTGANNCGSSSNQPCGAAAPTNGLAIEGNTLIGTVKASTSGAQLQVVSSTTNAYVVLASTASGFNIVDISTTGHLNSQTITGSTVTSCGTLPNISGSDVAGIITTGSGSPTACTLTFAKAFSSTPTCVVNADANITPYISSRSASAYTWTFSSALNSGHLTYICIGSD